MTLLITPDPNQDWSLRLLEFVENHLAQGHDKIAIYVYSVHPSMQQVGQAYLQSFYVHVGIFSWVQVLKYYQDLGVLDVYDFSLVADLPMVGHELTMYFR